jgi:hypothetical protein
LACGKKEENYGIVVVLVIGHDVRGVAALARAATLQTPEAFSSSD